MPLRFFSLTDQQSEKAFLFFRRHYKYDGRIKLFEVDFSKSWLRVFSQVRGLFIINLINTSLFSFISTISPIVIAYSIAAARIDLFVWCCLFLIVFKIISYILFYWDPILRLSIYRSMVNSGYSFFLKVDPVNHSTRSSGQIISKINRASLAYFRTVDLVIFDIVPLTIAITSFIIIISNFSLVLGLASGLILIFMIIFNSVGFYFKNKVAKKQRIETQDKADAVNIESMQQAQYIRSTFSALSQIDNINKYNQKAANADAVGWRMSALVIAPTQIFIYLGLILIGVMLYGKTDNVILVAILLSYFDVSSKLFEAGRFVDSMNESYQDITNFFQFTKDFGTQTIPLTHEDQVKIS